MREIADMFKERCHEVFYPGKDLCVDESLLLYKGRLTFKQYIKKKRARFGIKFYEVCTSDRILLDFIIYHGNMNAELANPPGEFLITERIPITLMQRYMGRGHRLFVDNFYTSPKLAQFMLHHQTKLVGTVRPHRKQFPKDLGNINLDKGTAAFYKAPNKDILAVKYRAAKDNAAGKPKVVFLLSTDHEDRMANTNRRDANGNVVQKPMCIKDYNQCMGGVDTMDQQIHQLSTVRKTYKLPKKCSCRSLCNVV